MSKIFSIRKQFFNPISSTPNLLGTYTAAGNTTQGSFSIEWTQSVFSLPVTLSNLKIIRIHSIFTYSNHGYFNGLLEFKSLGMDGMTLSNQNYLGETSFSTSLDLGWDARSVFCWQDLNIDLGSITNSVNNMTFKLTANQSANNGPFQDVHQGAISYLPQCIVITFAIE